MKSKAGHKMYLFTVQYGCTEIRQFCGKFITVAYRLLIASALTYVCATWAIKWTCTQRGYKAYGGEYFVIPVVFYTAYKGLGFLHRVLKKHPDKQVRDDR
jgi:hypothetical protein